MTDDISRLLRVIQTSAPTAFKRELDGRTAHGVISDAADLIDTLKAERDALKGRSMTNLCVTAFRWCRDTFGAGVASDTHERGMRFLEEALELGQSIGIPLPDAINAVQYVYGRDKGDPAQETGGTMVTLAVLCAHLDIDLEGATWTEIDRIHTPEIITKCRAKQNAKSAVGMGRKCDD